MARHRRLPHGLPGSLPGTQDRRPAGGLHRQDPAGLQDGRPQASHHARYRCDLERPGHGGPCYLLRGRSEEVMIAMSTAPNRMCIVRALALGVACAALAATTAALAK